MRIRRPEPEVIGDPNCPILHRWTILPVQHERPGETHEQHVEREKQVRFKLLLHHFLPNADDRDVHDHPRGFWTFVLRGSYDDMKPCESCRSTGRANWAPGSMRGVRNWEPPPCGTCKGETVVLNEHMKPGMLRYRPAEHKHRTKVSPEGCWTIVVMGKLVRPWGFWRESHWYGVKEYEKRFGFGMRCD